MGCSSSSIESDPKREVNHTPTNWVQGLSVITSSDGKMTVCGQSVDHQPSSIEGYAATYDYKGRLSHLVHPVF